MQRKRPELPLMPVNLDGEICVRTTTGVSHLYPLGGASSKLMDLD